VSSAMSKQMSEKPGFLAALDQSGGSTPGALKLYGIPETAYNGEAEMFKLMHDMRVRIMSSPAFTGDKVIAAILFERTMDGEAKGKPVPAYLWEERGVVPIVKVDDRQVGAGTPGPITRALLDGYRKKAQELTLHLAALGASQRA